MEPMAQCHRIQHYSDDALPHPPVSAQCGGNSLKSICKRVTRERRRAAARSTSGIECMNHEITRALRARTGARTDMALDGVRADSGGRRRREQLHSERAMQSEGRQASEGAGK